MNKAGCETLPSSAIHIILCYLECSEFLPCFDDDCFVSSSQLSLETTLQHRREGFLRGKLARGKGGSGFMRAYLSNYKFSVLGHSCQVNFANIQDFDNFCDIISIFSMHTYALHTVYFITCLSNDYGRFLLAIGEVYFRSFERTF